MNKAAIVIGGILLLFNIAIGMLLSAYPKFNCILNSCIIIANIVLLIAISSMPLKDGYKVMKEKKGSQEGKLAACAGTSAPTTRPL